MDRNAKIGTAQVVVRTNDEGKSVLYYSRSCAELILTAIISKGDVILLYPSRGLWGVGIDTPVDILGVNAPR